MNLGLRGVDAQVRARNPVARYVESAGGGGGGPGFTAEDYETLRALNAEDNLLDFIRLCWSAVEPANKFVYGWPIEAIAEHLTAVSRGQILRLIINVPPGTMKSLATQVWWPAWEWGPLNQPQNRYICASYSSALTERDNGRTCQLIHSAIYQKHWGDRFKANDSRIQILNDKTGWKLATSVGGVATGARGSRVIIDDALSVKDAESSAVRDTMQRWIRETMPTRLEDPKKSAIVVIEQRTHESDATGTLLGDEGGYEHLMIPMEWDGRRYTTSIGWSDPRTVEDIEPEREDREWWRVKGELCFPERFPVWVVERDKKAIGSYACAGQFQQAPSPRGGGIIQRDWWQYWRSADPRKPMFPVFDLVIGSYDGAHTTKTQNDPCAMAVMGTFRHPLDGMPKLMLARCWSERMAINDAVKKIDETARRYRVSILLVENKANGHDVVSELHRLFLDKPYMVVLTDPRGSVAGRGGYDKVARAMSVVPLFEDEMVYAPQVCRDAESGEWDWPAWCASAIDECAVFPRGSHDDQVDVIVQGVRWLRDQGVLMRVSEALEGERAEAAGEDERGRLPPLYRS